MALVQPGKARLLFLGKHISPAQSPARGDARGTHHGPFLVARWPCVLLRVSLVGLVSPNKDTRSALA